MALTQDPYRVLALSLASSEASSAINCKGFTRGILEVSGLSAATVTPQGRVSAFGGWYAVGVVNLTNSTGAVSASIVSTGLYRVDVAGLAEFRTNTTNGVAETLNIGIRLTDV